MTSENLFELINYAPHEKQRLYHNDPARFRVVVAGRRFGKSAMAARDKEESLFDPTRKVRGWIVGPTYALAEKEFRYMWDDLVIGCQLGPRIKRKAYNVRSGEMYIEMPWGSRVDAKSADHPDGLVGEGLDWIILAEAAKLPAAVWEKYLRPALADRHGSADFITTPEGFNWIYDLYMRGQKESEPEWSSYQFPSWMNHYVYPQGEDDPEIAEMRRNNPDAWFRQEIGAEFTAFSGQIYSEFDPKKHIDKWEYNPAVPNFLAVDFGFTNPFVALDIQVTSSDEVHVWREYYKTQETTHYHGTYLRNREQPPGYSVEFGVCDAADPSGKKTLEECGVAQFYADPETKKDLNQGINEVKKLLNPENPRLFIHESCEQLLWEIQNYRTKEVTTLKNENNKEEPRKFGDHGLDALRYFIMQRFVLGAGHHLNEIYETTYNQANTHRGPTWDVPDEVESDSFFSLARQEVF